MRNKMTTREYIEKSITRRNNADMYFQNGKCNKADFKRANDQLNLGYENLNDALTKIICKTSQEERIAFSSQFNDLIWKKPHYVHQWNQSCTDVYNKKYAFISEEATNNIRIIVEEILKLKKIKENYKNKTKSWEVA